MQALPKEIAFSTELTPENLYGASRVTKDEHPEESEELAGFAHDLAVIRGFPEVKS